MSTAKAPAVEYVKNHRNISISLADIGHYILSFSTAFTPMLKTCESYKTECITTME